MFGYFDVYMLLFISIKSDLKIAQKIDNNLINENMLIKTRYVIFGDNQFMSKHTLHIINPSAYMFQLDLLH